MRQACVNMMVQMIILGGPACFHQNIAAEVPIYVSLAVCKYSLCMKLEEVSTYFVVNSLFGLFIGVWNECRCLFIKKNILRLPVYAKSKPGGISDPMKASYL